MMDGRLFFLVVLGFCLAGFLALFVTNYDAMQRNRAEIERLRGDTNYSRQFGDLP